MDTIKHIVNNFLCTMFGHKESRTIMAYHIDTYSMSLNVEIYIVSLLFKVWLDFRPFNRQIRKM